MLSTSPIINIHLNLKSNLCRLLNKHNTLFQLLIFAVILFVSAVQVVIHYRLNQQAALQRLSQYHLSRFKLYSTYVMTHTILLLLVLLAVSLYLSQPLSLIFYLKSLLLILIYEIGIVFILFHIQTISHRLFMTFIYALAMGIVYLIIFM